MSTSSGTLARDAAAATIRPGWPEVAVGLAVFVVVGFGGGAWLVSLDLDPIVIGQMLNALSGIAGLAGFAAAFLLRIRSWGAFGVRKVPARWLLIGLGVGVLAFAAKGLAVIAFTALTAQVDNPQVAFSVVASEGWATVVLATVLMGVLTPLGEEFLFRGVLTSAMLRYGPVVGVVGGASIFALFHGINVVLPAAFVAGLAAGEVFRRSGSIWPAVVVHVVFNLPTIPIMALVAATA